MDSQGGSRRRRWVRAYGAVLVSDVRYEHPVRLLWTGGWDSSFRLLHRVLVQGRPVLPYYVVSRERRSLQYELDAMARLRAGVEARGRGGLLLPTVMIEKTSIPANEAITAALYRLRKRYFVGLQYEWLSRLAWDLRRQGVPDRLEMCEPMGRGFYPRVATLVESREVDGDVIYTFRADADDADLVAIYRSFTYPTLHLTKPDMLRLSREHGFFDLMDQTWTCHFPTRRGGWCGRCNPCKAAYRYGMTWRMSLRARGMLAVRAAATAAGAKAKALLRRKPMPSPTAAPAPISAAATDSHH